MMPPITSLTERKLQPDEAVVDVAERVLKMAQSGELRSISVVGALRGGSTFTDHETTDAITEVGRLELLKAKLLNALYSYKPDDE